MPNRTIKSIYLTQSGKWDIRISEDEIDYNFIVESSSKSYPKVNALIKEILKVVEEELAVTAAQFQGL